MPNTMNTNVYGNTKIEADSDVITAKTMISS